MVRPIDAEEIDMFGCTPTDWSTGAIDLEEAQNLIDSAPTLNYVPIRYARPMRYARPEIDLHHYFLDEDFGDLVFYANIKCSECGKKIKSISGDTIEDPRESYNEKWEINPLDLYEEQTDKIRKKLKNTHFDNYCANCGAKLINKE